MLNNFANQSETPGRSRPLRLAIISDIHYTGPAETARRDDLLTGVESAWRRWLVGQFRHHIWLRDAFAHNPLLDRFLEEAQAADFVVANGDFSCNSAFIGVSDEAAYESASLCLGKLRGRFDGRFAATMGDHEIGKKMLAADTGGLRLASYHRAEQGLGLEPFWQKSFGRYVLMGIASTLVALPVYEPEARAEEMGAWRELRERHLKEIRRAFAGIGAGQRVLLFCHDPTALPYLWREPAVREKLPQVERTIIGHLHSKWVLRPSRLLAGMPVIRFLGHTPQRLSSALREAKHWQAFRPLLCPSPCGMQWCKDGGYYTAELDLQAATPARFEFHPLPW